MHQNSTAEGDTTVTKELKDQRPAVHSLVSGEKELRKFLEEKGWGSQKSYWVSAVGNEFPHYCPKAQWAVKKFSKFLAMCTSIEQYKENGVETVKLRPLEDKGWENQAWDDGKGDGTASSSAHHGGSSKDKKWDDGNAEKWDNQKWDTQKWGR